MAELPDIEYNRSIPNNWYANGSTAWLPKRWAYGGGSYGSQLGNVYGYEADGTTQIDWWKCAANNLYCIVKYLKNCGWSFKSLMAIAGNIHHESNFNPGQWQHIQYMGDLNRQGSGFGLVQWTPPRQYVNPAKQEWGTDDPFIPYYENGWYECYMLANEAFGYPRTQWVPHSAGPNRNPASADGSYPDPNVYPTHNLRLTFQQFIQAVRFDTSVPDTDMDLLDYLTEAFYWDYEQVADHTVDHTLPSRKNSARDWYSKMLPYFGDFPATTIIQPTKPTSSFTINDLDPQPTQSKLIYYIRPWWQRIGR